MKKVFEMLRVFCLVAIGMCIGGALENGAIIMPCIVGIGLALVCIMLLTIAIWQKDDAEYWCTDTGEIVVGKKQVIQTIIFNLRHYNTFTPHWEKV